MKRSVKTFLSLALAAWLSLALCGCAALTLSEQDRTELAREEETAVGQSIGQALVATYAADHIFSLNYVSSSSFNPYITSSAWNKVVDMLVYETLVEQDGSFAVQPNLITSWQTEDGISWTFSVDTERTFHDGGEMTAADAVYSIQQAMALSSQYAKRFANVRGVSAIDRSSFAVTLRRANYRFYELLNIPCIEYNTGYDSMPPGTGPYMFSQSGRYLKVFEGHPMADRLPLSTIHLKEYSAAVDILQAFEDSYLDLVINDPTGMSSLGYSSTNLIKYVDTTSLHYLGYNTRTGVFGQSAYRAAMTYAIDRASIVSDVMQGAATPATLPIHPLSALYPADWAQSLAYSAESFHKAMANVGIADVDGDGIAEFGGRQYTINFVVCSDSAAKVFAARAIAKNLREAGIDVNLRELDYDDYVKTLEDGNFDIYYAETRLCGDWDLSQLLSAEAELNYGGVRDATLENHIQAALAGSEETLAANAAAMYQYIGQNAPITAICFEKSEVLYHRGVLTGISPTQDNLFYHMQDWTVELG